MSGDEYVQLLDARMRQIAPDNRAIQPIAMSYEASTWYVFLHIDQPGRHEVTIDSHSHSFRTALATAWRHLCNFDSFERGSMRAAQNSGIRGYVATPN